MGQEAINTSSVIFNRNIYLDMPDISNNNNNNSINNNNITIRTRSKLEFEILYLFFLY